MRRSCGGRSEGGLLIVDIVRVGKNARTSCSLGPASLVCKGEFLRRRLPQEPWTLVHDKEKGERFYEQEVCSAELRSLAIMLGAMILGALFGWLARRRRTAIKPLGTVFINMMFCIVVPLVFASIAGAVANMKSRRRAGKIMGGRLRRL